MKAPSGETRLLLILAVIVLLGGGWLVINNKDSAGPESHPTPKTTPKPLSVAEFDRIFAESAHKKGDPKARFHIVEFADFECPSCRRAYEKMISKFGKSIQVYFAFRHKPLPNHTNALPAALAAEAANKQGKFWEMYEELFTDPDAELSSAFIEAHAKKIGINMDQFKKEVGEPSQMDIVKRDIAESESLNILSTPTFLLKDTKDNSVKAVVGGLELLKAMQGEPGVPTPEPQKKLPIAQ